MISVQKALEVEFGYEVKIPVERNPKFTKPDYINSHFNIIQKSDAILVLNYDKNGINNYIGANTFLEIGVAFFLNKKIYLLNSIPEQSNSDEIVAINPVVLNGDFSKIV
jgi:hypothetical protein